MALISRIVRIDINKADGVDDPVAVDLHVAITDDDAKTSRVFGEKFHTMPGVVSRAALEDFKANIKVLDPGTFPEADVDLPVEKVPPK